MSEKTLINYKYVAKNVPKESRLEQLDWTHHREVAKLPPKDQRRWLKKAAPKNGDTMPQLSVSEMKQKMKAQGEQTGPDDDAAEQALRVEIMSSINKLALDSRKLHTLLGDSAGLQMITDTVDHLVGLWKGWLDEQ